MILPSQQFLLSAVCTVSLNLPSVFVHKNNSLQKRSRDIISSQYGKIKGIKKFFSTVKNNCMKNSIKQLFRKKWMSILFFCIIMLGTVFFALGCSLWMGVQDSINRMKDTFTAIGTADILNQLDVVGDGIFPIRRLCS